MNVILLRLANVNALNTTEQPEGDLLGSKLQGTFLSRCHTTLRSITSCLVRYSSVDERLMFEEVVKISEASRVTSRLKNRDGRMSGS